MAHGLTTDRLRSYLDHDRDYETETAGQLLDATLAAAVRFCERYCRIELVDPVDADLADAIYTAAARQWRERDAAFSDIAQRIDDGSDVTYFRGLPQRVKMIYDLARRPLAVRLV